jgi:hypothetical protein
LLKGKKRMIRIGIGFSDDEADTLILLALHIEKDRSGEARGERPTLTAYGLSEDEGEPYEVKWSWGDAPDAPAKGRAKALSTSHPSVPVTVEVLDWEFTHA